LLFSVKKDEDVSYKKSGTPVNGIVAYQTQPNTTVLKMHMNMNKL
jgi:hypothetical protein